MSQLNPSTNRDNAVRAIGALLGVAVLIVFCIFYTAYQQRVADRRWCALIGGFDDRYRQLQTTDPAAKDLAGQLASLRMDLGCPPSAVPQVSPSPSLVRSSR